MGIEKWMVLGGVVASLAGARAAAFEQTFADTVAAFKPLYSSWYCFHQDVFAKDIEAECAAAADLGMKTVIVDDGWQTDDTNRGYAFCGDWEVSRRRFPDMAAHVKRVQEIRVSPKCVPSSATFTKLGG